MKLIISALMLMIPFCSLASEKIDRDILSCYEKSGVGAAWVSSCMISLSNLQKEKYNKEFQFFLKKTDREKNAFNNYNQFRTNATKAKKNWDRYIVHECKMSASLNIEESPAYYSDYHECLVRAYEKRIIFYDNYNFEE